MSKTIPIWTCVLNRAIANYRSKLFNGDLSLAGELHSSEELEGKKGEVSLDWDSSLHLPLWVSTTERAAIEDRLEAWTNELESSGADIASIALGLKKPLRPLWISQKTVIWLNEVPDHDSWDFTPIILVSASFSSMPVQIRTTSEFSWNYIAGAGDDEESWARGLTPSLFWSNAYDLINSGPDVCNRKVADIVEKDRVYHAQRGYSAPQVKVKDPKPVETINGLSSAEIAHILESADTGESLKEDGKMTWLGTTNIAVGSTLTCAEASDVDGVLNCSQHPVSLSKEASKAYLHLPMVSSKLDRFSLLSNLPSAVKFARSNLCKGRKLLVCCPNGEDISVCVCLAILMSLYNEEGTYDDGESFKKTTISKWEMRRRLVYICKFAANARPSRGNLKQVFSFLSRRVDSDR